MDSNVPNSKAGKDLVQLITLKSQILLHTRNIGIIDVVPIQLQQLASLLNLECRDKHT